MIFNLTIELGPIARNIRRGIIWDERRDIGISLVGPFENVLIFKLRR